MSKSTSRFLLLCAVVALCADLLAAQRPGNGPAPTESAKRLRVDGAHSAHGYELYNGDIIRDRPAEERPELSRHPRPESVTIAYSQYLWPKVSGVATVYYTIDAASDPNATSKIDSAISIFNSDFPGLIQWVPWTSSDGPNYVDFNLSASDLSGTCEAAEGYEAEPAQPVTGSTICAVSTILHEMGHAIGLWHEQTRADRDTYLTVNYGNVIKGSWSNFNIVTDNAQMLGLFDYASIMEYEPYSFSRNGGPVIETIPAGIPLGSVEGLPVPSAADYSAGDKEAIERLYGAAPTSVTVTSNPPGLQVEVDGATVTTPQTFAWALNSTHTLNVPSGVQTLTGDIEGSTTSSTFYYTYGRWNDSAAQSHTIVVTPGNGSPGFPPGSPQFTTYSANFVELVPSATSVSPAVGGQVAVSPQPQSYSGTSGVFLVARQQASLTATPSSGYNFYGFYNGPYWLPGGLSANPKTFYVPDTGNPINTTAYFTPDPVYTIDVTPDAFSSNLGVVVDGGFWYTPKVFSPYYDSTWTALSSHTLDIDSPQYPYSVNSRYSFSSWSDGGAQSHSIASLPGASTSYIATVAPQFAPATNFSFPPCSGTGAISPASPTNDGFYPSGQQLSFSASPTAGWTFGGWANDITGTANPASLTATDEALVFANFNTTGAVLTLTSLSPSSALAGGKAFTLTLNGTGFTPNSLVFINNQFRASTYVSGQQLQVAMTATDIASPTNFQVFVENFPSGWNGCAVYGALTFSVQGTQLASMTSPAPGSTLSGSSTTFIWTSGSGAAAYWLDIGTTGPGSSNVYNSGSTTQNSVTVSGIPTNGVTLYVTLFSSINGSWQPASYTYLESGTYTLAAISSPAPGSVLPGSSVTFSWSSGAGPTAYWLYLGTTAGSSNVYSSGSITATSVTVNTVPTNGVYLYATLYSYINKAWKPASYIYSESGTYTLASITSPAQGSILGGSSVTFSWSAGGGPTMYYLYLGTTGYGSSNVYNSGNLNGTSVTVNGIPTNGGQLFATLFSRINNSWVPKSYTFIESGTPVPAALTSPVNGSTLPGPSATFQWSPGSGVTAYYLYLGTTGVGTANVYNSGVLSSTSVAVNNIPANGVNLYVTLFSQIDGSWKPVNYIVTQAGTYSLAAITSPAPGSILSGSSSTFTWNAGAGPTAYTFYLGTTGPGSANVFNSGAMTGTSVTVNNIPTNGVNIYGTLFSQINGVWKPANFTFTQAGTYALAMLTTPAPGTALSGSTVTFGWTAGAGPSSYWLELGSTGPGSSNLYSSGPLSGTSVMANGLPTNGETVYATLFSNINGSWKPSSFTYTASTGAARAQAEIASVPTLPFGGASVQLTAGSDFALPALRDSALANDESMLEPYQVASSAP